MRRTVLVPNVAVAIAIAILMLTPDAARAQIRRSASPDGAAPTGAGAPKGVPRIARHPYAGVWQGLFRIPAPDASETPMPIVMVFDVADSAKSTYSGATILPNVARAPFNAQGVLDAVTAGTHLAQPVPARP